MAEIGRISPTSTVLFGSPHGALRDVDPSVRTHVYNGYSYIEDMYL